jgi:outer membrane protein TolC
VPFLTLWGREKLFGELLTKKLETAKEEVMPQIESELAKAMLNLTAHVHDYIDKRAEDIRQNTESAYATLLEDLRRNVETQIAEKSVARAEENLRICREHYRGGLSTMTVLLDAQRQQQQALTQRHSAISEYLQAKTRYLIVTGRSTY